MQLKASFFHSVSNIRETNGSIWSREIAFSEELALSHAVWVYEIFKISLKNRNADKNYCSVKFRIEKPSGKSVVERNLDKRDRKTQGVKRTLSRYNLNMFYSFKKTRTQHHLEIAKRSMQISKQR